METSKKIDLVVLVSFVILAASFSYIFNTSYIVSTLLFFALPSVYLHLRRKKNIKKILFASMTLGIVYSFGFEFINEYNNAWSWSDATGLLLEYRILGVVPIDVMIWLFCWVFLFITYYEHFINDERSKRISKNARIFLGYGIGSIIIIVVAFLKIPDILKFNYAYLIVCMFILFIFSVIAVQSRKLILKILPSALFFFTLHLVFEITALKLGQWRFPGQYVGMLKLFGVSFPIEEFLFWITLSSTIGISYYEFFIDDNR